MYIKILKNPKTNIKATIKKAQIKILGKIIGRIHK